MPLRVAALTLALAVSPASAGGGDAARIEAALCARAIDVRCEPALPYFCGNIHVSCSGRTDIEAFPFRLRAKDGSGRIEVGPDSHGIRALYDKARAHWDDDGASLILRPTGRDGYVRLRADGRYSLRLYAQDAAIMSYGECR